MRLLLGIIAAALIFTLFIGALFIFGPLKRYMPSLVERQVKKVVPNFFIDRPGVSNETGLPNQEGSTEFNEGIRGWTITGAGGASILVQPFVSDDTATTTPTSEPRPSAPPTRDTVIARDEALSGAYILTYIASDQSFTLTLTAEPLKEARAAGEAELLKRLGITETQACALRYVVLTPRLVSDFYSGINLGFSFCPGATQL